MSKSYVFVVVFVVLAALASVTPVYAQNGCPQGTTWEQGYCVATPTPAPTPVPACDIFCQVRKYWTKPVESKTVVTPKIVAPVKTRTLPICQPGYGLSNKNVCVKITVNNVTKEVAKPLGFFAWVACMAEGKGTATCGSGK